MKKPLYIKPICFLLDKITTKCYASECFRTIPITVNIQNSVSINLENISFTVLLNMSVNNDIPWTALQCLANAYVPSWRKTSSFLSFYLKSSLLRKCSHFLKSFIKPLCFYPIQHYTEVYRKFYAFAFFWFLNKFHLVLALVFFFWITPICCWGHKKPSPPFLNFLFSFKVEGSATLNCSYDNFYKCHGNTLIF